MHDDLDINPATGLPMVGGIGGVDIEGISYVISDDSLTHDHLNHGDLMGNVYDYDSQCGFSAYDDEW